MRTIKYCLLISLISVSALIVSVSGYKPGSGTVYAQADYSLVNVRDTVHINSCGSCHLPYSPGLLPMQSWQGIMAGLENHFGNKVEISPDYIDHILNYFEQYALREGQASVMGRLAENLPLSPPLRITELPAFVAMHKDAEEVLGVEDLDRGPLSTCENCHRAAASHIFDKALLQVGHGDGPLSDYK